MKYIEDKFKGLQALVLTLSEKIETNKFMINKLIESGVALEKKVDELEKDTTREKCEPKGCGKKYYVEDLNDSFKCGTDEESRFRFGGIGIPKGTSYEEGYCDKCKKPEQDAPSDEVKDNYGKAVTGDAKEVKGHLDKDYDKDYWESKEEFAETVKEEQE